jgi:tetratricopeptide (TPR) repeat protein
MKMFTRQNYFRTSLLKSGGCGFVLLLLLALQTQAESFTNLLSQSVIAENKSDTTGAFKILSEAEPLTTNCADLCALTKRYCDLMHDTDSPELQKTLAEKALTCARRAVQADPKSATAHLCVAVGYVKNFPYADNRTKVEWSKGIKTECETAIALDPKQDVGYYLLGRWNFGVANMNFIYKGLVKIIYGGLPEASDEAAIENFKKAIALNPNRIIHHAELGKVYVATDQNELARAEFKKCANLKPMDRDDADAQREAAKLLND